MKLNNLFFLIPFLFIACETWGDYHYESETFKFEIRFPDSWEIWDRSDGFNDFLIASIPDVKNLEITVTARKVSPDISPHEIFPQFLEGGRDASYLQDFEVIEQGIIHAKNADGRFIRAEFTKDNQAMQTLRTIFLGHRFILEVHTLAPKEKFPDYEPNFRKMISLIELNK